MRLVQATAPKSIGGRHVGSVSFGRLRNSMRRVRNCEEARGSDDKQGSRLFIGGKEYHLMKTMVVSRLPRYSPNC